MESYSLYSWAMERHQEMLREAEDRRRVKAARRSPVGRLVPFPAPAARPSADPAEPQNRRESA